MKILYVINEEDSTESSGVHQKISQQTNYWIKLGHSVELVNLYDLAPKKLYLPLFIKKVKTFIALYLSTRKLKYIIKSKDFDVIYSRAIPYTPYLNILKHKNFIIELNSKDLSEYKKTSKILYFYTILTRYFFYNLSDGFVAVSNELANYYNRFNKKTAIIANSLPDLSKIDLPPHEPNKKAIIGFIGSENCPWHGIDKFTKMAMLFPEYNFEIIGIRDIKENLKNLKCYGELDLETSCNIMNNWTIGVSSLSLHLKNMNEASSLKSRLYMALKLPIIYAYDDTDEPINGSLKIPNTSNNIEKSKDKIDRFIREAYTSSLRPNNDKLNALNKERSRMTFFKEVLNSKDGMKC